MSGRTGSRPPQKVARDDQWKPTMTGGTPMSIQEANAIRGRELQRPSAGDAVGPGASSTDATPTAKGGAMGIAKNTTQVPKARRSSAADFSHDDDSSIRPSGEGKAKGKGQPEKGKGKPDKGKGKGDKGDKGRGRQGDDRSQRKGDRTRSRPTLKRSDAWCLRATDPVASAASLACLCPRRS